MSEVCLFFSCKKFKVLVKYEKYNCWVLFCYFLGLYIMDSKLDDFCIIQNCLLNSVSLLFAQINHSLSSHISWFGSALLPRTHLQLDPEAFCGRPCHPSTGLSCYQCTRLEWMPGYHHLWTPNWLLYKCINFAAVKLLVKYVYFLSMI